MPTTVNLGLTPNETAQNVRVALNSDPAFGVVASGDDGLLLLVATAGNVTMAASGSNPVLSGPTLSPFSSLKAKLGGLVSDLRGVTTMFYSGLVCSNNPYPKVWALRVKRSYSGWYNDVVWQRDLILIPLAGDTIQAMNGAHIIYQCLTDPSWGRGLLASAIDDTAFTGAAQALFNEGFGLCLKWSAETSLDAFVQTVIDHIGAILYTDRATGLQVLKLIRGDYDPASLPVFDYDSGLLEIKSDDSSASDSATNEIIVTYTDPTDDGKDKTVRVQALASIQANGGAIASATVSYPGIPEPNLAMRVGLRDLALQASGIKRFTLVLDRRGRKIQPGTVFKLHVPSRGIENMIIRAGKVEEGPITSSTITVTGVEDVFGLSQTGYLSDVPSTWIPPDTSIRAVATARWRELSYRDLVRTTSPADLAYIAIDSGFVCVAAQAPTSLSVDFVIATEAGGNPYVEYGAKAWTPTGTTAIDLGIYSTFVTLQAGATGLNLVSPGGVAWIGNECIRIDGINPDTNQVAISRGALDTVPLQHAVGTRMWFPDATMGSDGIEYTSGETVSIKLLTRTNSQKLSLAVAPELTVLIAGRQGRPYPPGDVKINGTPYGTTPVVHGQVLFSWEHRNRINQADFILVHTDAGTTPEPGTTYTVRLYNSGGTLIRQATGITGTSWTYDYSMIIADSPPEDITAEVQTFVAGRASLFWYRWSFKRLGAGFDNGFDADFDGS